MAYNPLYGYDTALYGYGQANQLDPSGGGYGPAKRAMPAWMNDLAARGIGVANDGVFGAPASIDIPRGDGSGGIPAYQAPTQTIQEAAPGPMGGVGWQPESAGAGGGAEGSNNGNASFGGSGQGLGTGVGPGVNTWGGLLDALGLGSTQLGDLSGLAGPQPNNVAVSNLNIDPALSGIQQASMDWSGPTAGMGWGGRGTPDFGGGFGGGGGQPDFGGVNAAGAGGMGQSGQIGDLSGMSGLSGAPGLARGGMVTRNKLQGPDPDGPDDGYGALNVGEGVLTARALRHYGDGIIDRLNKLQVPKKALSK